MKLTTKMLIPVAIALATGAIELRVAVGRLETSVADVDHRVTRIEQRIDTRAFVALEDQH